MGVYCVGDGGYDRQVFQGEEVDEIVDVLSGGVQQCQIKQVDEYDGDDQGVFYLLGGNYFFLYFVQWFDVIWFIVFFNCVVVVIGEVGKNLQ